MGFIKISYNGNDTELHKLGDRILYYTDYRNFSAVQNKTNASIETQVKCPGIPTYKEVDGEYIATNDFSESVQYYIEDGTLEVDCPACGQQSGKEGYLKGDDGKYYICPRCGGTGHLIMAIDPSPIISINVSQNTLEEDGYAVTYRIVPGGQSGQSNTNMTSIVIENEQFVDPSNIDTIINYWQELENKLDAYYRTTEKVNDNFYATIAKNYQEKRAELQELKK